MKKLIQMGVCDESEDVRRAITRKLLPTGMTPEYQATLCKNLAERVTELKTTDLAYFKEAVRILPQRAMRAAPMQTWQTLKKIWIEPILLTSGFLGLLTPDKALETSCRGVGCKEGTADKILSLLKVDDYNVVFVAVSAYLNVHTGISQDIVNWIGCDMLTALVYPSSSTQTVYLYFLIYSAFFSK